MNRNLFFLFLCFSQISTGQNLNPKKLDDEIFQLNNEEKYNSSIIKLEEIINSKAYTNYDKYHAYLQKSFTYKRLLNHSAALDNLDQALDIGLKTNKIREVESRILVEKLFISFDRQKYDEVDEYLKQVDLDNIKLIDEKTQAFFLSLLGVLDMRKKDFKSCETKFDQAIKLLEKASPQDLPTIYQKKITLHHALHQPKLALESYEKGIYYAEKYKMSLYRIIMMESLVLYYAETGDYKSALQTQYMINDLANVYNNINQGGQLNVLEKKLLKKRKDLEIEYEKKIGYFLIFLIITLIALIFVLVKLHLAHKERNILMQRENRMMRVELEQLAKELDAKGEQKLHIEDYDLTERQIEIIDLIKAGKTNKEIGAVLFISENTVKYHLKIIYNILGIGNRWDLKK